MDKNLKEIGPLDDVIFKNLFGKPGNERMLEGLLKAFLDINLKVERVIEDNTISGAYANTKKFKIDVFAELEDGSKIDVEVQNYNDSNLRDRIPAYPSRMYSNDFEVGDEYRKANKVISLWIFKDVFSELKKEEEYISQWQWKSSTQKVLTDKLEIDIVELGKIKKLMEAGKISKRSKIGMWTRILLNPEEIGEEEMDEKEYRETIEKYHEIIRNEGLLDRAFREKMQKRERYWQLKDARDEGLALGKEEGRKKGHKEGREERKREQQIEMAKKMLEKNKPIEEIMEFTELTKEEIENIDNLKIEDDNEKN